MIETISTENIQLVLAQLDGSHRPERPEEEKTLVKWLHEFHQGFLEIREDDLERIHAVLIAYWRPRQLIPRV